MNIEVELRRPGLRPGNVLVQQLQIFQDRPDVLTLVIPESPQITFQLLPNGGIRQEFTDCDAEQQAIDLPILIGPEIREANPDESPGGPSIIRQALSMLKEARSYVQDAEDSVAEEREAWKKFYESRGMNNPEEWVMGAPESSLSAQLDSFLEKYGELIDE
jgi:hypothetical protein